MTVPSSSSARIDVVSGPLQGQSFDLLMPETIVGREPGCHILLDSYHEVSRRHARFYFRRGEWCIEDLGSTNGTFVNSARATPSFSLVHGAQIQMGDFHARFNLSAVGAQPGSPPPTQFSPPTPAASPQRPMPATTISPVAPAPGSYYPVRPEPPKNVAVAILLSFLYAGLGQLYNGETDKAFPMLVGYSIGIVFTLFCFLGLPAMFAIWIWGMLDAYQSAERINREAGWPR